MNERLDNRLVAQLIQPQWLIICLYSEWDSDRCKTGPISSLQIPMLRYLLSSFNLDGARYQVQSISSSSCSL